jgi:hypothetical protein
LDKILRSAQFGILLIAKAIDFNRDEIFQNNGQLPHFWTTKESRNFGSFDIRTSQRECKKMQIELATPCNKNEQEQKDKNNAEL